MKVYLISLLHMEPDIVAFSLMRGLETLGIHYEQWMLLHNYWPIERPTGVKYPSQNLADLVDGWLLYPDGGKNIGGHGGFNYCVKELYRQHTVDPNDLIIIYDPDSNPVNAFWGKAMCEVMQADPSLGAISLMLEEIVHNRNWQIRKIGGHTLAQDTMPEKFNVTGFRAGMIQKGLLGAAPFYGGVEAMMYNQGMKQAYLLDYREAKCPIPHPDVYTEWKYAHATRRFSGNFDEYLRYGNVEEYLRYNL